MNPVFNIFETPWLLIIVSAGIWATISVVSMFRGIQKDYYRLLIPLLLVPVAFAVDFFVKTDYEKVDNNIKIFTSSAVEQTPEKIPPIVSQEYSDKSNRSKSQFTNMCNRYFSEPNVKKINRRFFNVTFDKKTAVCQVNVVIIMNPESPYAEFSSILTVEAKVYFAKNDKGRWLMTSSEIISVNNNPASWGDAP